MPEGDTITRAAHTLQKALRGKTVTRFESVLARVATAADNFTIVGRTVDDVHAVGKHLLMIFSGDIALRTHMRMKGGWHIYRPGERWQRPRFAMRIVLATADFEVVGFDIPDAQLATTADVNRTLARLGPSVLAPSFSPEAALAALRALPATKTIADALLDQRALAGVGNAYKSEILFLVGLDPRAPIGSIDDVSLRQIIDCAHELMHANVGAVPDHAALTYRGLRRTTGRANPRERLWVYDRAGLPCRRCGTKIQSFKQGDHARTTYVCPRCQPAVNATRV